MLRTAGKVHNWLFDIGFDSKRSMELREYLQKELEMGLPATLVFEHPNLAQLISFIEEKVSNLSNGDPS